MFNVLIKLQIILVVDSPFDIHEITVWMYVKWIVDSDLLSVSFSLLRLEIFV